jgi:hypothetical protein
MTEPNVECVRCGLRWYSESFEDDGEVPDVCTRCYRDDVREIPPEPSILEKSAVRARKKAYDTREFLQEKHDDLIIWKENNRALIELSLFVGGMVVIVAVLYLFIFRWG